MNLTETARTRRADASFNPIEAMPYAYGITIRTAPSVTPASEERTSLAFPLPLERELDATPWHAFFKSCPQAVFDMGVFEDELETSAHYGQNTVLHWITAQGTTQHLPAIDRLTQAVRGFYSIEAVCAIGIDDRPGEKSVYVLLNSAEQSNDLLTRLIDVEETVQGKLSDAYLAFSYISMAGRSAESLAPSNITWIKK